MRTWTGHSVEVLSSSFPPDGWIEVRFDDGGLGHMPLEDLEPETAEERDLYRDWAERHGL